MEIYNDISELPHADTHTGFTSGKFEGIHTGHQRLFRKLAEYCGSNGLVPTVIAFRNDPRDITGAADHIEHMIYTIKDRAHFIGECGIERIIFVPFNQNLAHISAASFVTDIMKQRMKARYAVCGKDFRFGRSREGDARSFVRLCSANGIKAEVEEEYTFKGEKISSSKICRQIKNGEFEQASRHLGRRYHIEGTVHKGRGIGKTIGFPTLNIWYPDEVLIPEGVFAAVAEIKGKKYHAAVNSGKRPTFGENGKNIVEVHLLTGTVPENIIHIKLYPVVKIRDEKGFSDTDTLSEQIRKDCSRIKRILQDYKPLNADE